MSLTAESILQRKRKTQKVSVPEWCTNGDPKGSHVYITILSGTGTAEVSEAMERLAESKSAADAVRGYALAVKHGLCDEDGTLLFAETPIEEVLALEFTALERCGEAVMAMSGITAKAQRDIAKNSKSGRRSSGGSA